MSTINLPYISNNTIAGNQFPMIVGSSVQSSLDQLSIEPDWVKHAREIMRVLGVKPGDRIFVERDNVKVQLINPLDEEVVQEVLEL